MTVLQPSKGIGPSYDEVLDMFKSGTVKKYVIDFNTGILSMGVPRTEQELKEYDEKNKKKFDLKKPPKNIGAEKLGAFNKEEERRKQAFEDKRAFKLVTYQLPNITLFLDDSKPIIDEYNKNNHDNPIRYNYIPPVAQPWWISMLPNLLLIGLAVFLVYFMMKQTDGSGKAMGLSKFKARQVIDEKDKVMFSDVAGADEEKEELREIVEFLKDPIKFNDLGAKIPKGVLLVGPPGTGKTLLAKAAAGEAGVAFFSMSGSDFVEMFVGMGARRVRGLFKEAKEASPSIVFIDEIDAVGRKRGLHSGNDEREQTLNQLLVEMDGFSANQGVIVIAATNRRDVLDPAILRPGRFDRQIFVNRPDIKGREDILRVHTKNKPLAPSVDIRDIAKGTVGFTGADLANIVNEAALLAAKNGRKSIEQKHIENAIMKVLAGPEKKTKVVTEDDKKLTAYHEAGHAIVTYFCKKVDKVHEISIIPRGMAGGYTLSLPEKDETYKLKEQLFEEIIVLLGGRSAENVVLDDISTGASNDIQRVTQIAKAMVTQYGFSNSLGPIVYGNDNGGMYGMESSKDFSESISTKIDEEVRLIVFEAYSKARGILKQNIEKLHLIANVLIEFEKIDGTTFEKLMSGDKEVLTELKEKQDGVDNQPLLNNNNNADIDIKVIDEKNTTDDEIVIDTDCKDSTNDNEQINNVIDSVLENETITELPVISEVDVDSTENVDDGNISDLDDNLKENVEMQNNDIISLGSEETIQKGDNLDSIIDLTENDDDNIHSKKVLDEKSKEQIKKAIADNIKNKYFNKKPNEDMNVSSIENSISTVSKEVKKKEIRQNKLSNSLIDIIENNTNNDNKK